MRAQRFGTSNLAIRPRHRQRDRSQKSTACRAAHATCATAYTVHDHPSPEPSSARRFILLLGLVSLFADATYESARSILGQFLATLGATATSVGLIAGLGELLNNGLRVFSGLLADRTRRPWRLTILGFSVNVLAVPLLAMATTPLAAAGLMFAERSGKAIRNPPRDAMLAAASHRVGRGRGFGLQEALGQIGAVLGPLSIAWLITRGLGYRAALALLFVPALLTLTVLLFTRHRHPDPIQMESPRDHATRGRASIPRTFWVLVAAAALIAAGYLDFALIGFSMVSDAAASTGRIPRLYALAMATQAVASLAIGPLFDRRPVLALIVACAVSIPVAMLAFRDGDASLIAAMVLWGLGLGAQKTVFKASVARLVPLERRATAYGAFFAVFGLSWFLGSLLMGHLHDAHRGMLPVFSVGSQLAALPLVAIVARRLRDGPALSQI
jgi:MFS family permease